MESSKSITAVEWLVEQLFGNNEIFGVSNDLLEQAKEMEKQQIIDAYSEGDVNGIMDGEIRAEKYYNETFKI